MEKSTTASTRDVLLDTGITLIGTLGIRQASARAVEDAAGVPHGSVRHHFGGLSGFLAALVEHVFTADRAADGESTREVIARWLGTDRIRTRARYELMLLATRDEELRRAMVGHRDRYVEALVDGGLPRTEARQLVAALDGLVLDALLRDSDGTDADHDPTPLLRAFR
ncbi:AcrR family transcriptional regulator [Gordonia terrae]|uniref:TetR/AcrR family transcriptional regulator n=1 Tax=unclassified Gordonia (in: high G+C Gram-positive bacteria) TaxID=2657482 RepID=UPI001E2DE410|nr:MULTISPECIES: TetR/AcrR family transcriptional regulator [Gordonia]MCG7635185.1 TetR/AcrR family transcriptional regulator [Gordonia sp. McavH-238-E]UPW08379.1 TetR/AcrR family transcriptional regulator [Gordonia terrae]